MLWITNDANEPWTTKGAKERESVLIILILHINNLGYMSQIRSANSFGERPGMGKPW